MLLKLQVDICYLNLINISMYTKFHSSESVAEFTALHIITQLLNRNDSLPL